MQCFKLVLIRLEFIQLTFRQLTELEQALCTRTSDYYRYPPTRARLLWSSRCLSSGNRLRQSNYMKQLGDTFVGVLPFSLLPRMSSKSWFRSQIKQKFNRTESKQKQPYSLLSFEQKWIRESIFFCL
jgi:hypothetical protein